VSQVHGYAVFCGTDEGKAACRLSSRRSTMDHDGMRLGGSGLHCGDADNARGLTLHGPHHRRGAAPHASSRPWSSGKPSAWLWYPFCVRQKGKAVGLTLIIAKGNITVSLSCTLSLKEKGRCADGGGGSCPRQISSAITVSPVWPHPYRSLPSGAVLFRLTRSFGVFGSVLDLADDLMVL
jgi:hypothetical protein